MKVVLNTDVIVSRLLSPYNAPGEIVRMTASGDLGICYYSPSQIGKRDFPHPAVLFLSCIFLALSSFFSAPPITLFITPFWKLLPH